MTLDEIKAAVDAGKSVHWSNEGYLVHKDVLGQYLITFLPNGSTIGLTNATGDRLNGKEHEFFISSETLGHSLHCSECGNEDVMQDAWTVWNADLQMHEVLSVQDHAYCNTCDGEAKLVRRMVRDYGGSQTACEAAESDNVPLIQSDRMANALDGLFPDAGCDGERLRNALCDLRHFAKARGLDFALWDRTAAQYHVAKEGWEVREETSPTTTEGSHGREGGEKGESRLSVL